MLLTIPWLGGLILGRVDVINGIGKDQTRSKFTLNSFFKQVPTNIFVEAELYFVNK